MASKVRVGEVFIAGGQPTVTYNPREELALERRVSDYLAERYRVLSVSGPTKAGKTVLLRRVVQDGIWVPGGDIHSLNDFWNAAGDQLGIYEQEQVASKTGETTATAKTVTGGARPLGVGVSGEASTGTTATSESARTVGRTRPVRLAAKEELLRSKPTIVIDDFHYVDTDVQAEIIRGVKDLVFEGVGFVVASVPHRSYDAVRVEKEMTGRVEQLPIPFWSEDELLTIPREGFAALNLRDPEALAPRLARESFSSPLLMQDFSLQLVKANDISETVDEPVTLRAPDWDDFFRSRASGASKPAFDLLSQGPRQRRDRIARTLRDRSTTDIYGAVLKAIAHTGPLTELRYVDLRAALREVLADDVPSQAETTRVLQQMSAIARERLEGEPVVDYDAQLETLHISDPYFAFYLRWAVRGGPDGQ
jgi:hypothetical protein